MCDTKTHRNCEGRDLIFIPTQPLVGTMEIKAISYQRHLNVKCTIFSRREFSAQTNVAALSAKRARNSIYEIRPKLIARYISSKFNVIAFSPNFILFVVIARKQSQRTRLINWLPNESQTKNTFLYSSDYLFVCYVSFVILNELVGIFFSVD